MALQIGQFLLDVTPGTDCAFDQEVVSMAPPVTPGGAMQVHQLGKLSDRLVATPDLDHLLRATQP